MDTGSFLGLQWPGCGPNHPSPSNTKVKKRVELYIYSPFGPLCPLLVWTLPLPLVLWNYYLLWVVSKTKNIMYNAFLFTFIIQNFTRYRVKHWMHRVILHVVQNGLGFPFYQQWPYLLCSFHFIMIWPAPSNLTTGISLMWLAHNGKSSSRLLSATVVWDRALGAACLKSTRSGVPVPCICPLMKCSVTMAISTILLNEAVPTCTTNTIVNNQTFLVSHEWTIWGCYDHRIWQSSHF